jgi:adenylate kinase family enzyme
MAPPARQRRIHVTGGPGSGKTTVARRLAALLEAPLFDLDGLALGGSPSFAGGIEAAAARLPEILAMDGWVSEGAYMGWAMPLFDAADAVVWMDLPWRVASYRILTRHLKAELARNNRFPGWRRLWSFWRWCGRYYNDANLHRLNAYGVPHTRALAVELLRPYEAKLISCRTDADIERLLAVRAEG